MRKRIKSLGVLTGVGDLLLVGDKVATVRYRIQQDQEVLIADAIDGSREELDGLRETHGTVTPGRRPDRSRGLHPSNGRRPRARHHRHEHGLAGEPMPGARVRDDPLAGWAV